VIPPRSVLVLAGIASAACAGSSDAVRDGGHDAGAKDAAASDAEAGYDGPILPGFDSGSPCESPGAVWAKMDAQPVVLFDPMRHGDRFVAGLDLDGKMEQGLSLAEAIAVLCTAHALGTRGGSTLVGWGISNEVKASCSGGGRVEGILLSNGYLGSLRLPTDPKGPDAGHVFEISIGQLRRDGSPWTLDWKDPSFTGQNQLYNAILYNSGAYPGYSTTSCRTTSACPYTVLEGIRRWSFPAAGLELTFPTAGSLEAESSVLEMDIAAP